jgi:hypothetical protein
LITFKAVALPEFCKAFDTLLWCLDWVVQGITPRCYAWLFRVSGILPRAEGKKNELLDTQIQVAISGSQWTSSTDQGIVANAVQGVVKRDASFHPDESVTNEHLRDEVLELLITGQGTTASSLCWALKYLTDDPRAQDKLREQVFQELPGAATLCAKDILTACIPYLDAVIAETLRCSGTGPVSFRETVTPCTILGHDVPAGTPLVLLTAGPSYTSPVMPEVQEGLRSKTSQKLFMHKPSHDQIAGQKSERTRASNIAFNPDRWLADESFDPEAVHMLHFSAGSRGCFGKKTALLEMRVFIVLIIMNFKLPKLPTRLSGYKAIDGLTRQPRKCYVSPIPLSRTHRDAI